MVMALGKSTRSSRTDRAGPCSAAKGERSVGGTEAGSPLSLTRSELRTDGLGGLASVVLLEARHEVVLRVALGLRTERLQSVDRGHAAHLSRELPRQPREPRREEAGPIGVSDA